MSIGFVASASAVPGAGVPGGGALPRGSAPKKEAPAELELLDERSIEQQGPVGALGFSPDGNLLAAGSAYGALRVWDVAGKEPKEVAAAAKAHPMAILCARFSPDGKVIATGSYDKTARLWALDGPRLKEKSVLKDQDGGVKGVAFTKDGKTLATGGDGATVFLWDLTKDPPKEITAFKDGLGGMGTAAVVYSPDQKTIAMTYNAGNISLWDVGGKKPVKRASLTGPHGFTRSLAFSPDGRWLASGGGDKIVRLWTLQGEPKEAKRFELQQGEVSAVAFSPDGRLLASATDDGAVVVWDVGGGKSVFEKQRPGAFAALAFRPAGVPADGQYELACGNSNGKVYLYHIGPSPH